MDDRDDVAELVELLLLNVESPYEGVLERVAEELMALLSEVSDETFTLLAMTAEDAAQYRAPEKPDPRLELRDVRKSEYGPN